MTMFKLTISISDKLKIKSLNPQINKEKAFSKRVTNRGKSL